jgi:acyl-CoA dehydrogenase
MIDYAEFKSAIGLNWYDIDLNLQFMMRRLLAPADFDWLEPELRKIGTLCGGPVAARAEVTDKHPPELVKFDRWGDPLDEVRHHPGALATKRDLWETGVSGPRLNDEARRRGRHLPETVRTALNYMLSQPRLGCCARSA